MTTDTPVSTGTGTASTFAAWQSHLQGIHARLRAVEAVLNRSRREDWESWGCPRPPRKGEPAGPRVPVESEDGGRVCCFRGRG